MTLARDRRRNQPSMRRRTARRWIDRTLEEIRRQGMDLRKPRPQRRRRGINENYARELMELHTLGVDGGYTQQDVIEVARVFTGWTVLPPGPRAEWLQKRIARRKVLGFVQEGDFLFRADMHDATEKIVLGQTFPAGGGMEEGHRVLKIFARHPKTAWHISQKLAVRFVSDHPPESLIKKLTQRFLETQGDLHLLIRTIAYSPEFWREAARRKKVKSPFEVAVSALRALNVNVRRGRGTLEWIARMGQPLYAYQAPSGYPDHAEAWINTGSLLSRMTFGLSLALRRIPGTTFDLSTLNKHRRDESFDTALQSYAGLILPERDLTETLRVLSPVPHDPVFLPLARAYAIGVILGSPEFQRR